MNADGHADEAFRLAGQANHFSYGDGGDPTVGLALAAEGIVHALLSLRPEPQVVEAAPAAIRMHIFGEDDGPTVTLTLPRSVVEDLVEAVRVHVPASAGIDGALIDEVWAQLDDQPEETS